jgi:hypothetical protein
VTITSAQKRTLEALVELGGHGTTHQLGYPNKPYLKRMAVKGLVDLAYDRKGPRDVHITEAGRTALANSTKTGGGDV